MNSFFWLGFGAGAATVLAAELLFLVYAINKSNRDAAKYHDSDQGRLAVMDRGLMLLSAMLAIRGTKKIETHRKITWAKKVYLPVIQPEAMPLADRKRLLAKKIKARRRMK